ncbi:Sec-independent protein translocase subunit TatA [Streptomyces sp. NBC_00076]|uniref:Sec-independent protein translocase subunit TatA n=1 Tax=Streptomyces sp. NBC_00076 TaxID=2975642 RepID=UPI00325548B7
MLRNGLEPWHLLVLAIVIIVLFGSKKLPDTARAFGKSMRILKSEAKALKDASATPGAQADAKAEAEAGPTVTANVTGANGTDAKGADAHVTDANVTGANGAAVTVNVPVSEPPAATR